VHVPYRGPVRPCRTCWPAMWPWAYRRGAGWRAHQECTLRPLAVTTLTRTALLPDIATVAELSDPGLRSDHLARPSGAGRHAVGDRNDTPQGDNDDAHGPGGAQVAYRPRRRCRGNTRRVRSLHRAEIPNVGGDREASGASSIESGSFLSDGQAPCGATSCHEKMI